MKTRQRHRLVKFQAFLIGFVLLMVIGLTRGILYEEQLVRSQYFPGTAAIGIFQAKPMEDQIGPIGLDILAIIQNHQAVLTEFIPQDYAGYDYLGTMPGYFELFTPPLRAGRFFTAEEQETPVCVISEGLAKSLFPTISDSIGKPLASEYLPRDFQIIGVIEDSQALPVKTVDKRGLSQAEFNLTSSKVVIYPIFAHQAPKDSVGVFRSIWLAGTIQDAARISKLLSPYERIMELTINPIPRQAIGDNQTRSFAITLLLAFAFLVVFVSALGMFGIQLIQVFRRQQEIGLRVAVGARPNQIVWLILRESGKLLLIPGLLGIVGGYLSHSYVTEKLGLPCLVDIPLIVGCGGLTVFFSLLVGAYPAWKAATMDPIESLGKTPRLS